MLYLVMLQWQSSAKTHYAVRAGSALQAIREAAKGREREIVDDGAMAWPSAYLEPWRWLAEGTGDVTCVRLGSPEYAERVTEAAREARAEEELEEMRRAGAVGYLHRLNERVGHPRSLCLGALPTYPFGERRRRGRRHATR